MENQAAAHGNVTKTKPAWVLSCYVSQYIHFEEVKSPLESLLERYKLKQLKFHSANVQELVSAKAMATSTLHNKTPDNKFD